MLKGPQMKEANPIAKRIPALLMLTISDCVPNSAAISGVAGKRDVLEKVAARVIQLAVMRIKILRHVGYRSDEGKSSRCTLTSLGTAVGPGVEAETCGSDGDCNSMTGGFGILGSVS